MDQKLTELVNKVESEARAFASFDDYLASKEKGSEWQKPASDVVEKSSSESSEKVDATVESSEPTSAEAVTVPTEKQHPHSNLTPEYIANGHKVEPAHPVATPLPVEAPPSSEYLETLPAVEVKLELTDPLNWDGQTLRHAEEVFSRISEENEPEWWREVYLAGRELGVKVLKDPQAIADRINILEEEINRRRRAQHGLRSALDDALKAESIETRKRTVGELDLDYQNRKRKKLVDKLKKDRGIVDAPKAPKAPAAPKAGIGIKMADTMAQGMGLRGDALIEYLRKMNKIDDATVDYIKTKWGAK